MAVKKPAMVVKMVHSTMQTSRARTTRARTGRVLKSNTWPKTEPVFGPWCITMVAAVMPIPTIRPMDRSVPANKIRPATPSARNILGEACCRMFRMLLTVSSGTFFTIGVMIHRAIKMTMIARYKPLRSRKSLRLKVYL